MGDFKNPITTSSQEPTWLDDEYVQKILANYCKSDQIIVRNYTKNPATTKGENYFSALYLLTIDYSTEANLDEVKNVTFMLKTRLESDLMSQLEEDFDVFAREAQYYTVINEETQKLMNSIKDNTQFGPK